MKAAPGAAFVLAAATVWATIGLAGRAAFCAGVTPLEAAFYRAGLSFAVVLTVTLLTSPAALRVRARDLWLFAAYGLISIAIFFYVYLYAIERTSIATAAILLYTAPAFVAVLSALIFKEPLTGVRAVAVALAVAGCVLVVRGYDLVSLRLNLPGVLAGLASGFTYAMYSIFGKSALRRYSTRVTLTYALGFGTIFLGGAAVRSGAVSLVHSAETWLVILYLALVTTLLAGVLYLSGLRRIEPGRASLIATIEPVVASVLGYAVLRERLAQWQVVGGLLVGSVVVIAGRAQHAAAAEEAEARKV